MSQVTVRRLAILEPVSIFVLIMAYIWSLRFACPWLWLAILGLMLVSHALRREDAARLGFRLSNLRACLWEFAPALAFFALLMLSAGFLLQTTRPIGFDQAVLSWAAYLPWGVFQQYILNGYFLTRFDALASRRAAPLIVASLFAGAHTPNWFLMAVTLLLGYCCALVYRRCKNLYFLGLAHGTVGFLLYFVVPDSISHHLNVGPGWFR
jgi:hypothetical protein